MWDIPRTLDERINWAKRHGYDCIVQCPTCGRTQYLEFKNGLKHGWHTCCGGLTMPIIWQNANIDKAVSGIVKDAKEKAEIVQTKS